MNVTVELPAAQVNDVKAGDLLRVYRRHVRATDTEGIYAVDLEIERSALSGLADDFKTEDEPDA